MHTFIRPSTYACAGQVHFDMPTEEEEYCHRAGRTGRFGRVGTVVSVLTEDELFVLQRYIHTHIDACTQTCSLFTSVGREWCACVRAHTRMAWKRTRMHLHTWRAIARGSLSSARAQGKTHRQRFLRS